MDIKESIFSEIDNAFDEQIEFLKRLVRCKSTLFNELSMQQEMAHKLRQLGLYVDMFDADIHSLSDQPDFSPVEWGYHNRPQVVGVWRSEKSGKGKSLVLNGHADVVPVEDEGLWKYNPWEGEMANGKMYGRGAGDMKCGLATIVYAIAALKKLNIKLGGDVIVQSVIEEEVSGNGTLACIDRGYIGDAALIVESNGPTLLMAQTGTLWLRTIVSGSPGHVEGKEPAINAIEKAYKVIVAIKELEAEWNKTEKHPSYKDMENVLNFSIGEIKGGCWTSSIPSMCEFTTRFNFYPGIKPEDMQEKIVKAITKELQGDSWLKDHLPSFMWFGFRNIGYVEDANKPFYKVIAKVHEEFYKEPIKILHTKSTSDTRLFISRGIPSTCYGPLGLNMHGNDEYVELSTIICVIIAGLIVEKTIFTRLRTKGHIMQIIAANGLAILMLDAIRIFWTADSIKMTTPFLDTKYNVGNVVFTQQRLFIVIAAILAIAIVILILYKSRFGLMMRALPQDNMAATLNGINISLVSSGTFALGCVLAVFGSVTIGPLYTLVPTVGTILDNRIIAAIILGGIGSVPGTVIAALFIGIIEAMTAGYIVTGYDTIIVFSVLILTLIFRPKGLFGKIG